MTAYFALSKNQVEYIRRFTQINSEKICLLGIIVLSIFLNFYNLGESAFAKDEAIYSSQAAILAGHQEYTKNFLEYSRSATNFQTYQFIMSIVFRLFGVNEFTARFPTAIMGTMFILIIYNLSTIIYSNRSGILSSFFMSINPYLIDLNRQVNLDSPSLFFMVLAILFIVKWKKESNNKNRHFNLFLIFAILSITIKIIIVIPLLILIISYLLIEKEFRNAIKFLIKIESLIIIFLTVLLIGLFIFEHVGFEEYIKTFSYGISRGNTESPLYYIKSITYSLGYLFIVTFLIGLSIGFIYRKEGDIISILWFVVVMGFYSYYPLKHYFYIVPIIPSMCILSGRSLDEILNRINRFKSNGKINKLNQLKLISINKNNFFNIIFILEIVFILIIFPISLNVHKTFEIDKLTIKNGALKDAALWLKVNASPNSGVLTYGLSDKYKFAFYSNLTTYSMENDESFPIPINGSTKIIWKKIDITSFIKNGKINYIIYIREKELKNKISKLEKDFKFVTYYHKNYISKIDNKNIDISILRVEKRKR